MMNKKLILTLFFTTFIMFGLIINVYAIEKYGFETVSMSQEQKETIQKNLYFKETKITSLSEIESPIINFDVSESENLLLGLEDKTILILNNEGKVLKSYSFQNSGMCYVKWENDNILLMLVRGNVIIELTTDGEIVDIIKTETDNVHNNQLWRNMQNNEIKGNGNLYTARNNMGVLNFLSSTYSQIVKYNNLEETIIFDVNESQIIENLKLLVLFVLMFTLVPMIVFKANKNKFSSDKTQNKSTQSD